MTFVGLDPGGAGAFGWCVLVGSPTLPLDLLAAGIADHAAGALAAVANVIGDNVVAAAGIDAPLYWVPSGERLVDRKLRKAIRQLGASSATVNHVNSLRGACLVQGMVAAMLLRRAHPGLRLTESHPKAALWMLGEASRTRGVAAIRSSSLPAYIDPGLTAMATGHERDAAIAALGAWAMAHRHPDWEDLVESNPEADALSAIDPPASYWAPRIAPSRSGRLRVPE